MPRKRVRTNTSPDFSEESSHSQKQFELNEREDHVQIIFVPNSNDSGDSDNSEDERDGKKYNLNDHKSDVEDSDGNESFNYSFR